MGYDNLVVKEAKRFELLDIVDAFVAPGEAELDDRDGLDCADETATSICFFQIGGNQPPFLFAGCTNTVWEICFGTLS